MQGSQEHNHSHRGPGSATRLWLALIVNLVFLVVEVVGGMVAHSLALLSDAGHMLTDVAALALSIFVMIVARRPATPERTFGLLRAEVLGAFANGAALVLIVGFIFWEAWRRFGLPQAVDARLMVGIAGLGLLANLGSSALLFKGRSENINIRSAFLHMAADTLGSVGAMLAGAVIWITGWAPADAVVSVLIGLLILWSSWGLLKEAINILLEATPAGIDVMDVRKALEGMDHVEEVHDLHVWTITSGMPVLSAHVTLSSDCCGAGHWQNCLDQTRTMLKEEFGIAHTTIQIEQVGPGCRVGAYDRGGAEEP